jgi:soluble lytic murein transglycosylase-like protein
MNLNTDIGEQKGSLRPRRATLFSILTFIALLGLILPAVTSAASLTYLQRNAPNFLEQTQDNYGEMVNIASLLHDYDKNMILAVIIVESEGNEQATSHKGAQGLMQLMPRTAKAMGAKDPKEPFQNILAGTKYLKQLEERYGFDSPQEALVAYNMGPTRARRWLSQYQPEDFGYVQKVMYVYGVLAKQETGTENLALFGTRKIAATEVSANLVARPLMTKPRSLSLAELPLTLPVSRKSQTETVSK